MVSVGSWRLHRLHLDCLDQSETLRRTRYGSDQYVRVEHVHINDGAQAVIGNVRLEKVVVSRRMGTVRTGDLGPCPRPRLPRPARLLKFRPAITAWR
jgi:hypothetical protein